MATFKEYKKKNGEKSWMFKAYLGVDPLTGKEVRTTRRNFKSKSEAQSVLKRLLYEFETQGLIKEKTDTYFDVYEEWIEQYRNTVEESTFVKTKRIFKNHILPFFGKMRIKQIKLNECQKAMNKWAKQLARPTMIMNYASKVFDHAIRSGIIDKNPTELVIKPSKKKNVQTKKVNFYTKQELNLFLDSLEKENEPMVYMLFRLLAYTGLRKGEALALTWSDIDFEDNTLTVNKALTRGENSKLILQPPKTKGSVRVISLDSTTIEFLKKWRITQRKNFLSIGINTLKKKQLIFSNSNNEFLQPTITRKYIKKVCAKYGLKEITTHGFRHTHCSLLFEAGETYERVQARLGHSDIQTTMNIYTHVSPEKRDETAVNFANYLKMG
jgi:integrase